MLQALQGFTSEAHWIRHARVHLRGLFPYVPDRPGYSERLRHPAGMLAGIMSALAADCTSWHDDLWLGDSERHEALLNPAVMKGHRLRLVAAGRLKLRAA